VLYSTDKKAKCRTTKTKKKVRMKYKETTREYKEILLGAWIFVVFVMRCVARGLCDGPITHPGVPH
jgi:hypothetical protein